MTDKCNNASVCREFCQRFKLGKERNPKSLVQFLLQHESTRSKVEEWLKQSERSAAPGKYSAGGAIKFGKDINKSLEERRKGNDCFKNRNLPKCLHHYNEAVKWAATHQSWEKDNVEPGGSSRVAPVHEAKITEDYDDCLAIAFANRSAVYFEIGGAFYDKALEDIELALQYGYPERLKSKILFRKLSICVKTGDIKCAEECFKTLSGLCQCNKTNDTTTYDDYSCCETKRKLKDLRVQIQSLENSIKTNSLSNCDELKLIENNEFEHACCSVGISTSKALGRFVIAFNDVEEDSLLFKELPFASVLLPEFYISHCHHCHIKLLEFEGNPYFFPCKRCTQVLYCSSRCFEEAEKYHKTECGFLELLQSVGIAHLAIRIILTAGMNAVLQCVENHLSLTNYTNLEIFKKGNSHYERVYSLMDHIDDMYEEDLFQYALTATLLTKFLVTKSSFFEGSAENTISEVGGALLRHICQLICNAHAITDVLPNSDADDANTLSNVVVEEYQKRIATAIYPCASIMNHSCDANMSFKFDDGRTLLVRAAKLIKHGQNVYNCYGPHYRRMPRMERQEVLQQQYFFNCTCDKCTCELNTISFADQFSAFKCGSCEGPVIATEVSCAICGTPQDVDAFRKMYEVVIDLLNKGQYLLEQGRYLEEAIDVFKLCATSAEKVLFKFHSQYGQICDTLARCYVENGNLKEALKCLKTSLSYVEARFGCKSLEYIRELEKYQDLNKQMGSGDAI